MATRLPQPVHETDDTAPAPGELELVRAFLSLHDHEAGNPKSLEPSPETIGWWLAERGLIVEEPTDRDLRWGLRIWQALRSKVQENLGKSRDQDAIDLLNEAADRVGLRVCFGCNSEGRVHTESGGVRGAVGKILGIAFLSDLDGDWAHLKECDSPTCISIFYDKSKNHSGRWCSMQTCGNRNKVRAFRERQAAEANER